MLKIELDNVYIVEDIEYGISSFMIAIHPKFANTEDQSVDLRKALKNVLEKRVRITIELKE